MNATNPKKTGPAIVQKAVSKSPSKIGWTKVKIIPADKIISIIITNKLVQNGFLKATNEKVNQNWV